MNRSNRLGKELPDGQYFNLAALLSILEGYAVGDDDPL